VRVPALERIHQLARRLEAAPHEHRLLAHHGQGIFEQPGLVFYGGRRRHCERERRIVRGCGELVVDTHRRLGCNRSPSTQGCKLPFDLRHQPSHHHSAMSKLGLVHASII